MRNGHHPETPPDGSGQTSVALAAEIRRTHTRCWTTASTRVAVLRRSDDRGGAVPPGQIYITAALMGVAILIAGGVVAVVNKGINPWELLAWFVSIGVLGVGLFFFAAAPTARAERTAAQRLRQVAGRMGPALRVADRGAPHRRRPAVVVRVRGQWCHH